MLIETTYDRGQTIFVVIGSDDKARIVEAQIASIDIEVIASGNRVTYNCSIDRKLTETEVNGMPQFYTVARQENTMFLTAEDCANYIIKRAEWAAKAKK